MNTTITLTGIPELKKALENALLKHKENDVRKALKRAANIIVDSAKNKAPTSDKPHKFETAKGETITIQPGNLRRSIMILPKWRGQPKTLYAGPKVSKRNAARATVNAYYAHWVEYGTAAHNLGYKGKYLRGQGANVKGIHPTPYMRPAYDSNAQQAINVAMEDVAKMIMNK